MQKEQRVVQKISKQQAEKVKKKIGLSSSFHHFSMIIKCQNEMCRFNFWYNIKKILLKNFKKLKIFSYLITWQKDEKLIDIPQRKIFYKIAFSAFIIMLFFRLIYTFHLS